MSSQSQKFCPQLESLSERVVPSANPKANFVADAIAAYQHAQQGNLTTADYNAINADVREIQAQYATAINQVITYYNSLPQNVKVNVTQEAIDVITTLQKASRDIGTAAYNLEYSVYEYDTGVLQRDPNYAAVHFAQANKDLSDAAVAYNSQSIALADQYVQAAAAFPTSQTSSTSGSAPFDPDNDGDDDRGETGY